MAQVYGMLFHMEGHFDFFVCVFDINCFYYPKESNNWIVGIVKRFLHSSITAKFIQIFTSLDCPISVRIIRKLCRTHAAHFATLFLGLFFVISFNCLSVSVQYMRGSSHEYFDNSSRQCKRSGMLVVVFFIENLENHKIAR